MDVLKKEVDFRNILVLDGRPAAAVVLYGLLLGIGGKVTKFKTLIFLALVCLASCQKQKEAAVAKSRDSGEGVSGEVALVDRIKALNSSRRDELDNIGVINEDFENVIWWDANRMIGFGYNKRILFYNGDFIVHDLSGSFVAAYGRYAVNDDGRIVCAVLKRLVIEKEGIYTNEEYYNEFFDYYKLFMENDIVTFTVKHDPNLYYNQRQLTSDPGGEFYKAKDEYTKADMIYYNDGVELYKYEGGIKQCSDRLNVREKPLFNARVIRVLDINAHVGIEARTTVKEKIDDTEDYWYYVNYAVDDQYIAAYGYVFGAYLTGGEDGAEADSESGGAGRQYGLGENSGNDT